TGAAPLEFSNSVGMPFKEGLAFVHDALVGFGLRKDIKIIASGKIITGFHIFRAKALGADLCYSARAMMIALGCIQALECNKNTCPTGVATQDPELTQGLVVSDKKVRVAHYQQDTIMSFVELMAAAGIRDHHRLNRSMVHRRISMNTTRQYEEIYPSVVEGCFLEGGVCPDRYKADLAKASAESFV
ncbi:MAG: glutamate synthase-related protein, partial [Bacteroidota bacterium]